MQEMLKKGVLILSSHNVSLSFRKVHITKLLKAYDEVLCDIATRISDGTIEERLTTKPLEPLFKIR